jgi:hypothetical protein
MNAEVQWCCAVLQVSVHQGGVGGREAMISMRWDIQDRCMLYGVED